MKAPVLTSQQPTNQRLTSVPIVINLAPGEKARQPSSSNTQNPSSAPQDCPAVNTNANMIEDAPKSLDSVDTTQQHLQLSNDLGDLDGKLDFMDTLVDGTSDLDMPFADTMSMINQNGNNALGAPSSNASAAGGAPTSPNASQCVLISNMFDLTEYNKDYHL